MLFGYNHSYGLHLSSMRNLLANVSHNRKQLVCTGWILWHADNVDCWYRGRWFKKFLHYNFISAVVSEGHLSFTSDSIEEAVSPLWPPGYKTAWCWNLALNQIGSRTLPFDCTSCKLKKNIVFLLEWIIQVYASVPQNFSLNCPTSAVSFFKEHTHESCRDVFGLLSRLMSMSQNFIQKYE